MSKIPELVVTAKDLEEVKLLLQAGANAVQIGNHQYAIRSAGDFTLKEIEESVQVAHKHQAKVHVLVNALMHNVVLTPLSSYLKKLDQIGVDAIIFGDPAVLMMAYEFNLSTQLHWSTETTTTNYQMIQYWASKGISRAIASRELSLESIKEIKRNSRIEIEAQVHGMSCIFQSKRELLSNYLEHIGEEDRDVSREKKLFMKESDKEGTYYPIYEDEHGTHIMSNEDICMLNYLPDLLDSEIDSFKIEGLYKSSSYNEQVVRLYRNAIDTCIQDQAIYEVMKQIWLKELREIQPVKRGLSTGFFFKEQIY